MWVYRVVCVMQVHRQTLAKRTSSWSPPSHTLADLPLQHIYLTDFKGLVKRISTMNVPFLVLSKLQGCSINSGPDSDF